jgi:hypothetical protein
VKGRLLSLSTVLCLSLVITGARAGSAQQVQPLDPEWLTQMYEEGWRKVQEGVLQRDTGGGQLETLSYGAEGLQWTVQKLQQQVVLLKSKHDASPNEDLANVIAQLEAEILQLSGTSMSATSTESFTGEALAECNLSYGGDAYAGPQLETHGITARASAYLHTDCADAGDTFAVAYAQAADGTVENSRTQSDPKNGGTWLDSNASASANGTTSCYSWAQGSVTVSTRGIYYQTPLRESFACSPPSTRLTLDPSRITLDGAGSNGDPRLLADEQIAAGDPRAGARNEVLTNWRSTSGLHVNAAIIDLGAVYRIERIYLYDANGIGGGTIGNYTVTAGSTASGWTNTLIDDPLRGYRDWKGFPNDPANDPGDGSYFLDDPALEFSGVTTRYLRIVSPDGFLGMFEIVVYGMPVPTCP